MDSRSAERERMVADQIAARGISDDVVLEAFRKVPRHLFLPDENDEAAYEDHPLAIGGGQTISQPYIVALMTSSLGLTGKEKVLEVGTGSGYQAAILSCLAGDVFTVERDKELSENAKGLLSSLGYHNIHFQCGDGTGGWPEEAPFDRIIVTAASPSVPKPLIEQLGQNGQMVIPVGELYSQKLIKLVKEANIVDYKELCGCVFVPLVGEHGWREE